MNPDARGYGVTATTGYDPHARQAWIRAAGIAAAYRELKAIPDDVASIGPAP